METSNNDNDLQVDKQVKQINTYICMLVLITILWAIVSFWYISEKQISIPKFIDTLTNPTNEVVTGGTSTNISIKPTDQSYNKHDIVIIKFFFIEGIIIEKTKDLYVILYKDQHNVLQKITLPEDLLFKPSAELLFPVIK